MRRGRKYLQRKTSFCPKTWVWICSNTLTDKGTGASFISCNVKNNLTLPPRPLGQTLAPGSIDLKTGLGTSVWSPDSSGPTAGHVLFVTFPWHLQVRTWLFHDTYFLNFPFNIFEFYTNYYLKIITIILHYRKFTKQKGK